MYDLCCIFLIGWKGFCVYNQICFSKFPSFSFCRSLLYATSENTFRCVHSFCRLRKDSAMFRLNKGGRLSMVVLTRKKAITKYFTIYLQHLYDVFLTTTHYCSFILYSIDLLYSYTSLFPFLNLIFIQTYHSYSQKNVNCVYLPSTNRHSLYFCEIPSVWK